MISVSLLSPAAQLPDVGVAEAPPGVVPGGGSAFGTLLGHRERQTAAKDGKALPGDPPEDSPVKPQADAAAAAPWLPAFTGTIAAEKDAPAAPAVEDADARVPIVAVAIPLSLPLALPPATIAPATAADRPVSPLAVADTIALPVVAPVPRETAAIVAARAPSPVAPVSPPAAEASPRPEPTIAVRTPTLVVALPTLAPVMPRAFRPLVAARAPVIALAEPEGTATPLPGAITTIAAITPSGAAASPALDMTRADWPATMIDRIERLRDDADAADTSIRVVPDALGRIHVSLRRDDSGTHVHFAADEAQTRALLADARPHLAELAEARGLRLAQASVGGEPGNEAGARQPPPRALPAAATPSAPTAAARTDITTDHRIA